MTFRSHWVWIVCLLGALESTVRPGPSANASSGTNALPSAGSAPQPAAPDIKIGQDLLGDVDLTSNIPPADATRTPAIVSTPATATVTSSVADTNAQNLASATYLVNIRQPEKAESLLVGLLAGNIPESVQKSALLELALAVRDENDLPRAQTIYAQYLQRWPADIKVPEILLRQGQIFRQMGLNDLALGKFYSVMTSALALKSDQFAYYHQLVLQTQIEIADTHYMTGQFGDAADFYQRLLLNSDPALNRPQIQFRLIRSLSIIKHDNEAVGQADDFIAHFPDSEEIPETRYYLAEALKALGRNAEALQQVLLCLQEQKDKTAQNPELWAYWQQRVGNEIANQLYHEGDYVRSLEVYINLAQLSPAADWQIPVDYQMGMTYEKLLQPQKAVETYNGILGRENETGTNTTPALKAVFDMARWRINFIQWQTNAEATDHSLLTVAAGAANSATNLPTSTRQ
jgi:tetratricopeptide (TPR) repeat protein